MSASSLMVKLDQVILREILKLNTMPFKILKLKNFNLAVCDAQFVAKFDAQFFAQLLNLPTHCQEDG